MDKSHKAWTLNKVATGAHGIERSMYTGLINRIYGRAIKRISRGSELSDEFLGFPTTEVIGQYRKNDRAVFLGSGPSVNQIADKHQEFLSGMDVWASNTFLVHDSIVPDFYHCEIKEHRNGPLFRRLLEDKGQDYRNTVWILDGSRPYLLDNVGSARSQNVVCYRKQYRPEAHGRYRPAKRYVQISLVASLTLILDLMCRTGYKVVYLIGVDLSSREYFWTNNPRYQGVGIPDILRWTKADEGRIDELHPTYRVAKFLAEFGAYNKIQYINLSQASLLRKYIPTITIDQAFHDAEKQ